MIFYLHGFVSGPQSAKAQALLRHMAERGYADRLCCPQFPVSPAEAVAQVEALKVSRCGTAVSAWEQITLVGSSLGGLYATWLAERHGCRAVVINPAVLAAQTLERLLGPQQWLHTGERFELTTAHLAEIRALDVARITRPERYWLLAEEADETCPYHFAVSHYAGARQTVLPGGDHSFTRWNDYLDEILAFAGVK